METMRWTEQNVSPKDSPPAPTIKNHSVTHFNGFLYCFGGYDGSKNHDTLLLYSIADDRWIRPHHVGGANNNLDIYHNDNHGTDTSIMVTGTPPPGRNGHSATLAADPDDEENARIIIIGGWLGTGPLAASDMHVLDISNGGKTLRWHQPAVKGTPPGPCNMHSADYVPQQREVYVFRGGNGREYLNDLHALSSKTLTWRKVHTVGQHPQQRANHSSALLEETGELFIFGGWYVQTKQNKTKVRNPQGLWTCTSPLHVFRNGTERLNDIHILNIANSTWTCPRAGGVLPHPRAGMTLTALRGRLFLFGGSGTSSKCFHDLQILDRQEMAWLDVTQYGGGTLEGTTNNVARHNRFEGDQNHHQEHNSETDGFQPQWRFGGYDPSGDSVSEHCFFKLFHFLHLTIITDFLAFAMLSSPCRILVIRLIWISATTTSTGKDPLLRPALIGGHEKWPFDQEVPQYQHPRIQTTRTLSLLFWSMGGDQEGELVIRRLQSIEKFSFLEVLVARII